MSAPLLSVRELTKTYEVGEMHVHALRGVTLDVAAGEFVTLTGPSGSGKSTLMHLLAGLDQPTSGTVTIDGVKIQGLRDRDLTLLRRRKVGFVFQFFNLLPMLTAEENVTLPLKIGGEGIDRAYIEQLLAAMGLEGRRDHKPAELSGGQQQRVAIARALATRPAVVFADEPTGNLDSTSSGEVLRLLREAVDQLAQTIVMVTHDAQAASVADRVVFLEDGKIVRDEGKLTAEAILDVMKVLR